MFGIKKNKQHKKTADSNVQQLIICNNCHAEMFVKPCEVVLGNFRYWFRCQKCGGYTRIRLREMSREFRRYFEEKRI